MPYINKEKREELDEFIGDSIRNMPDIEEKGDLEYLVFLLMTKYMNSREYRYSTLHDVVYAVAHCSDEFRRRYLDKREDRAIEINGDIDV